MAACRSQIVRWHSHAERCAGTVPIEHVHAAGSTMLGPLFGAFG